MPFDALIAVSRAAGYGQSNEGEGTVQASNFPQPETHNPLALIIEDDDKLSLIYAEALRRTHFEPVIVSDGAVAFTQVMALRPALIILDLHLPQVSGDKILHHIRQDADLAKTHVIVITADAAQATVVQNEADLILIKPISLRQLRDWAKHIRSTLA